MTLSVLLPWSLHRYHVSFPCVDQHRMIQPFSWCINKLSLSSDCWYSAHIFSWSVCLLHQLTLESFWGRNHDRKRFDREWSAKTVYKSDESFRNSSNDSVSSSNNEIDDTAVADAVINVKGGDEEETLHQDYMWEIMDNYIGPRELYNCDFGPSNGAENISDIVEHF